MPLGKRLFASLQDVHIPWVWRMNRLRSDIKARIMVKVESFCCNQDLLATNCRTRHGRSSSTLLSPKLRPFFDETQKV
jgi:hypothetical protein